MTCGRPSSGPGQRWKVWWRVRRVGDPINIFWSEEDDGYIAEVPTLPGCSAWGRNETEAARDEVRDAIAASVQAATAAGKTVPVPNAVSR